MATSPAVAVSRRQASDSARDIKHASGWISFVLERPLVALFSTIVTLVISSGPVLKLMPAGERIVETTWFGYLDPLSNILALGFFVFVGYRWSTWFAAILLSAYFLVNVPYLAVNFPREAPNGVKMILELMVGTGFLVTIEKLHGAVSNAAGAARVSTHAAMHDVLTNLPNRAYFQKEAHKTMASAIEHDTSFAILFLDLDNFKDVNDALGHAMGDKLLSIVSGRLQEAMRDGDTVARVGGDEFAIIAKDLEKSGSIVLLATRLIERISEPIFIDGHRMHTSPSIGIAPYPCLAKTRKMTDVMELLSQADMAMYHAKNHGGRSFEFFNQQMSEGVLVKHTILNDLRYAVARNELVLYYQPQYDMRSGGLIGAEALVRWDHPESGLMVPDEFIPVAESSGIIEPLGEWVLTTAAKRNKAWQDAGLHPIKINVNISPVQLRRLPIVSSIKRILEQAGLDPKYLDLELTENVLMEDVVFSANVLSELRDLGVSLSIDDFGTGYSSLSCLQDFSVDTLKIDKTFIKNITEDVDSAAIASAMIKLGHSLGINVIAEGIEKESDLKLLRALGCDQGQGFFYSEPLPTTDFERLLKESTKKNPSGFTQTKRRVLLTGEPRKVKT